MAKMGKVPKVETLDIDELYEVEKIIGKRVVAGEVFYKIQWKGYPESEATWESAEALNHADSLVREFEANNNDIFETASRRSDSRPNTAAHSRDRSEQIVLMRDLILANSCSILESTRTLEHVSGIVASLTNSQHELKMSMGDLRNRVEILERAVGNRADPTLEGNSHPEPSRLVAGDSADADANNTTTQESSRTRTANISTPGVQKSKNKKRPCIYCGKQFSLNWVKQHELKKVCQKSRGRTMDISAIPHLSPQVV